jgi:hypothetical protein
VITAAGAATGLLAGAIDETWIIREEGPALAWPPTAVFDLSRQRRYELTRRWSGEPPWTWVMLNPSTADAMADDQTIKRCCRYAKDGGAGGIVVVNLYTWRATSPAELWRQAKPVGEFGDAFILNACPPGRMVIAAWGAHGQRSGRGAQVAAMLEAAGVELHCLGVTKDGDPLHPSRLAAARRPVPYRSLVPA